MKKITLFLFATIALINSMLGINYTSAGAGPSEWNTASTWIPNGIPLATDNVTILPGHTVTINTANTKCKDLTIQGTIQFLSNQTLSVKGTFNLSGSEIGSTGRIVFVGSGNITVTGTTSSSIAYGFSSTRTITAGSIIDKSNATCSIATSKTVTNLGTLTVKFMTTSTGSAFINSTNAVLNLTSSGFMAGRTFTANSIGNTVNLTYKTGDVPTTSSGYYNLSIAGTVAGVKTLATNTNVANNLTINALNTLNTNNFDLNVGGSFTNNGTFTASTGKNLTFNGSASQNVSTTGTLALTNLTINNSAGVNLTSGSYSLSEVLTLSNGTFNTGGRTFTMLSTATRTARIAQVTGPGAVSGNFTIQRFIDARDTTWSCMASPVQNTTVADWDNELFIHYSSDPLQATVLSYDETVADYVPVSASGTSISPMQGFEVYLTADFAYTSISNITMNTIGNPTIGNQSMPLDYTNGSGFEGQNLVGNPFASSIDWTTVFSSSTNIDNFADVFDYTTGNYANVNLGDEIGLGQGFWVYALGAGATLNIPESAKTSSSNSSLRKVELPVFNLSIASANGAHTYAHKLELMSDASYSMQKDQNDRAYRMSPNKKAPKITSVIDGKEFVRNAFYSEQSQIIFPLSVSVGIDGKYTITANNIEQLGGDYTCVLLNDTKTGQYINLTEAGSYTFIATEKDAKDRFELQLSKNGNCRSMSSSIASDIENEVLILPTANGNSIAFNFTETLNTRVSVTNMLGQSIVETFNVQASNQTIELGIPTDFSGMYILTISNEQGMVSKKFVKK
ncbi:MAG: T9SS type A sorting domain-containing protein [Bacteroidetes bacterium]|nr:T9SS type A sorting domain-containing protein [Bacteroidota bacterium]